MENEIGQVSEIASLKLQLIFDLSQDFLHSDIARLFVCFANQDDECQRPVLCFE